MKLIEKNQLLSKIIFLVQATEQEWKEASDKAFDNVAKKVAQKLKLPGFRKGKVPLTEAKKYVDNIEVYKSAVKLIAPDVIKFVEQTSEFKDDDSETIDVPSFALENIDDPQNPIFSVSYDIYPSVTISKYDDLVLYLPNLAVSETEIENEITHAQKRLSKTVEKAEDAVIEKGDIATFSFFGKIDNEPFEGGAAESFDLEIGSNQFIPGFEEQMLGLKKGEEKSLDLVFPKDYHVESLANKPVVFDVKISKISTVVVPALDDDFAKQLNLKDVETYNQLKARISDLILKAKKENYNEMATQQITSALLSRSTITEIPQTLLDREFTTLEQQIKIRLNEMGVDLKKYLEITNKSEEEFRTGLYEQAKDTIKLALVISKIADEQNIEVSDEEAKEKTLEMAQYYAGDQELTNKYLAENLELVKEFTTHRKVMDFIIELNKNNKPAEEEIEAKEEKAAKPAKKAAAKPKTTKATEKSEKSETKTTSKPKPKPKAKK
ncbi:trigger factor [Ureaplasma diversum]|uniref:trigger factor n=1 Tax=Ureaplasma diversum TaxID=42094 RepID=UPI000B1F87EE|nr:trigger factor [Ureaplasma diversum]